MSGSPLWRKGYDAAERLVAPPLENAVRSSPFAQVLAGTMKLQRATQLWAERRTRRLWHAVNLPAGSDVRRLRDQLVALDRQVRRLSAALEDAQEGTADADHPRAPAGRRDAQPRPARGRAQRAPRP